MGYSPGVSVIHGRLKIKYVEMLFSRQFWRQKFHLRALFLFVFASVKLRGCDILPCIDCEEIPPFWARALKLFSPGRSNLLRRPCINIRFQSQSLCSKHILSIGQSSHSHNTSINNSARHITECRTSNEAGPFLS